MLLGKRHAFAIASVIVIACGDSAAPSGAGSGADAKGNGGGGSTTLGDGTVAPTSTCKSESGASPVSEPAFVRNVKTNETGWYASPAVADIDGDGKNDIIAAAYSTFVFAADGTPKGAKGTASKGRVYASHVVADIDGDGKLDVVVGGNEGSVAAYDFENGALTTKAGWPASTCSDGQCPEARGMAAADLDGDGKIEIVVTTTNTADHGAQVFVFDAKGALFAPAGKASSWPRYDYKPGSDLDVNGYGNHGYGCYGENVGIGNLDDDPGLEIVVTYDNHQLNVFKNDGRSVLASDWYTSRQNAWLGQREGFGQFIRWADFTVDENHNHAHVGDWPDINKTMWLQFTASPPNVVDIDGDGKNEIVAIPNMELHEPYETQGYAFFVLEGAQGDGSRAARRKAGFETLPTTDKPAVRASDDYYPPSGIPAPTTVNVVGDAKPEILAAANDGYVYAIGPDGSRLFRYDFAKGKAKTFASEVVVADLNKDGAPEIVFGTYGADAGSGHLVVLANTGALLFDVALPNQGNDGNGIGIPAAPTIADLDGDGQLEILVQTFDHGIDVFTVPGSGTACLAWPTGRGSYLRAGHP